MDECIKEISNFPCTDLRLCQHDSSSTKGHKGRHTSDAAKQRRLQHGEPERVNDKRVLVGETVRHLLGPGMQEEQP